MPEAVRRLVDLGFSIALRAGVDGNFHAASRPLVPAGSPLTAAAARLLLSPAIR